MNATSRQSAIRLCLGTALVFLAALVSGCRLPENSMNGFPQPCPFNDPENLHILAGQRDKGCIFSKGFHPTQKMMDDIQR